MLTVPAKKVTLSISYIGYDPVNVEATVGTFVKVVMKESSQTLNEVVVVGYGTQKKESVVGSVQMVKPDELKVPQFPVVYRFCRTFWLVWLPYSVPVNRGLMGPTFGFAVFLLSMAQGVH